MKPLIFRIIPSKLVITAALLSITCLSSEAIANTTVDDKPPLEQQSEEHSIGVMVKAINTALENPSNDSLEIITHYGTDSRYYVMIRGWLVQVLSGVQSQYYASQDRHTHKAALAEKIEFLQQALRRIDLE
ncbi:hypothetical protein L2729_04195 [Shewanella gelidimarina]|uniref:hypothetical protein n=1 Tax=Shewanella gelidimarina TaxID=56813 RepID=UPI00200BB4C3|nr:hypothetical protein [Shewanella gelidimarina]MCL1057193.1 hypothetical protein [Shewanella gelidimarina]